MGVDLASCSRRCSTSTCPWSRTRRPRRASPGLQRLDLGLRRQAGPAPPGGHPADAAPRLAGRRARPVAEKGFTSVVIRPAFYQLTTPRRHSQDDGRAHGRSTAARVHRPVFVEDVPFRPVWAQRRARARRVRPPVPRDHRPRRHLERRVRGAGLARLGAAHTVAEPIAYMQDADLFVTAALFHGLLEDLPASAGDPARRDQLGAARAREVGDLPVALTAVRTGPCASNQKRSGTVTRSWSFDSWEEPVGIMPDRLGEKAAWGSRYPNHDAAGPDEHATMLDERRRRGHDRPPPRRQRQNAVRPRLNGAENTRPVRRQIGSHTSPLASSRRVIASRNRKRCHRPPF